MSRVRFFIIVLMASFCLTGCLSRDNHDLNTVNFFLWGGDRNVNAYIDDFVTPRLKELYGINLVRTPMDMPMVLEKLSNEKQAGKETGTIDVIWINGENFKIAKEQGLLWGDIGDKIPNSIDFVDDELKNDDLGTDIEGMEIPWGKVKFAFQYNEKFVADPPANFRELLEFCKDNPDKFTYPQADDFTGNGFIKSVLKNVSPEELDLDKAYEYLLEIKPYLWNGGETYPSTVEALDKLYADGEVYFAMGYNENRAAPFITQGLFPAETKTVTFGEYTIYNCHYLSVPFNAPNSDGAFKVINYLLSEEAQLEKEKIEVWGDTAVLNLDKISGEYKDLFLEGRENNPYPVVSYGEDVLDLDAETTLKIKETWPQAIFVE